jgi:antitoxin (DNA-binding transcriptional repressor) of toxin-antitoxin stability system
VFDEAEDCIYLDDAGEMLLDELAYLRETRKQLEEREAQVRQEVLDLLAGRPTALTADGRPAARAVPTVRRNVDRQRLEAVYPDVFQDVITVSQSITLKIDKT